MPVRGPKCLHHRAISSAGALPSLALGSDWSIALAVSRSSTQRGEVRIAPAFLFWDRNYLNFVRDMQKNSAGRVERASRLVDRHGGGILNRTYRYTQNSIYFVIFTYNIWSYLLRSPVILSANEKSQPPPPRPRGGGGGERMFCLSYFFDI